MIKTLTAQLFVTFLGSALLWGESTQLATSYAAGGLLVAANFWILAFAWGLIFKKKLIALAMSLIVFKYAILGLIIYQLITVIKVDLLWFSMGVASFVISALIFVLWTNLSRSK